MVVCQGGVHTVGVNIIMILVYVTNITANIHLNNARSQRGRVWRHTVDVRTAASVPHQDVRHLSINHSHPYTNKARAT